MNSEVAVRLLVVASALMLVAGCILGFMQQLPLTVLLCVGALGCAAAALNFGNGKREK